MGLELRRNLVSYQRMLRAVGAYLDEYAASQLSLLEVEEGFAMRIARSGSPLDPTLVNFDFQDLVSRGTLLTRRRGRGGMAAARHRHLYSGHLSLDAMYQDLLRALGWELDESSARNVLVEELESGLFVTYTTLKNSADSVWTKRSARLGISELEEMLRDAYARRQPPPLRRRRVASLT